MKEIKKVAVIGAGVMGASIAAHLANAGVKVLLFDIVPQKVVNRSGLAESAIQKLLVSEPQAFIDPSISDLITACNLEDDLDLIKEVEWVIEAVVERLDIKQALYKKLLALGNKNLIVSSNTSTIPIHKLLAGLNVEFCQNFLITHFFNPPRYMKLLEIVSGVESLETVIKTISEFARVRLGKNIVLCKDTPGFIANRIGCFWLEVGIKEAIALNMRVDIADQYMSSPFGIPKTGIFGLVDLIGLDVMELIAKSFLENLHANDRFCQIYQKHGLIEQMILKGWIGRKGSGGFYKILKENNQRKKQIINLKTGEYVDITPEKILIPNNIREVLNIDSIEGNYSWRVMSETLTYAASLIPEIADDIYAVDQAMKYGFNWKYGPFELIDKLGNQYQSGAEWLRNRLEAESLPIPNLLKNAGKNSFYQSTQNNILYLSKDNKYKPLSKRNDEWQLSDIKSSKPTIFANGSCNLWDAGDDIVCLELTSKMNTLNIEIFQSIEKIISIVSKNYRAVIIATDAEYFSAGADLKFILDKITKSNWQEIDEFITVGQNAMLQLKYAPFPVISAVNGIILGGGAELALHSSFVQPYIESYMGLVEVGVGLIPGWGGCKEMISRFVPKGAVKTAEALLNILLAKTTKSAEQATQQFMLNSKDITFNRLVLLNDAKKLALSTSQSYISLKKLEINNFPAASIKTELEKLIAENEKVISNYDHFIAQRFMEVFFNENTPQHIYEKDLLNNEKTLFLELVRQPMTKERIEYMLKYNKPLKN